MNVALCGANKNFQLRSILVHCIFHILFYWKLVHDSSKCSEMISLVISGL